MDDTLVLIASLTFLVATLVYGAYLLRFAERLARLGMLTVGVGFAAAIAAIGFRLSSGAFEAGLYDLLLSGSTLGVGAWFVAQLRRPSPLMGAFLTPIVTMILYSLHVFNKEAGMVRPQEVELVTPIHIWSAAIGFTIFAVSAVAAALEIVQEYRLKKKKLNLNRKSRLPSLRKLETISHKAMIIGFPIYSIGMALGAVWFAKGGTEVSRHFIMATFSWVLYAVTLHARLTMGLQGRRAALLTLAAFVSALFVVSLSALRLGA